MMLREAEKFNEWALAIRSTLTVLKTEDPKKAYALLPTQCRWLIYWGFKLQEKDLKTYMNV